MSRGQKHWTLSVTPKTYALLKARAREFRVPVGTLIEWMVAQAEGKACKPTGKAAP